MFQNACRTLSPVQYTTDKKKDVIGVDSLETQSGLFIFQLNHEPLSYTGSHCMRPDGCNSFEVIFLNANDDNEQDDALILSTIKIGCLM